MLLSYIHKCRDRIATHLLMACIFIFTIVPLYRSYVDISIKKEEPHAIYIYLKEMTILFRFILDIKQVL